MAKLRNISPYTLDTRFAGRSVVTEPDGLLEVPDDVYKAQTFAEDYWEPVETHAKAHKAAASEKENS